mmetsp:Transcript_37359/g.107973  ORF Transcript_37359/g.107973 Transcript_37359/m.107973 type:complete len:227 (-) Transcript_37359:1028-1708(-)
MRAVGVQHVDTRLGQLILEGALPAEGRRGCLLDQDVRDAVDLRIPEDVAQGGSHRQLHRVHPDEALATAVRVQASDLHVHVLLPFDPLRVHQDEIARGVDGQARHVERAGVDDLGLPRREHRLHGEALAAAKLQDAAVHGALDDGPRDVVMQPLPVHTRVVAGHVADLSARSSGDSRQRGDIDVDANRRCEEHADRHAPLQAVCRYRLEKGGLLRLEQRSAVLGPL